MGMTLSEPALLNTITLTSQAETVKISNNFISGAQNVCNLDMMSLPHVAGAYTNPSLSVDRYGRIVAIQNGQATGTVTSVGLTSTGGTMVVTPGYVTTAGVLNVDLKSVPNVAGTYSMRSVSSIQTNSYGQITGVSTVPAQSASRWYLAQVLQTGANVVNNYFWVTTSVTQAQAGNNIDNIVVSFSAKNCYSNVPSGGGTGTGTAFCPDASDCRFNMNGFFQFVLWPGNQGPANKTAMGTRINVFIWVYGVPSWL